MNKVIFYLVMPWLVSGCAVEAGSSFDWPGMPGKKADSFHVSSPILRPDIVDERLNRIDAAIIAEVEAGKIPGAVALVSRKGQRIYHKSFGFSDIEAEELMRNDAIFRIASMTKAITTVGVMQLYEKGFFQLNDPISNYLPAFKNPQVLVTVDENDAVMKTRAASREIRIIDLLTHSSGLGYPFIPSPIQKTYIANGIIDGLTDQDEHLALQMAKLAELPLLFDPGSRYNYGLSTDVLGYLIEVVSGRPLNDYFLNEIFLPLEMHDTSFYLSEDKYDRLVTLYANDGRELISYTNDSDTDDSITDQVNTNYPISGAMTYFSGGAGLSSTASDYSHFIEMLLNNGELHGKRLLGRKSVELMRAPRMDMNGDGVVDFGLGFKVISDIGMVGELGTPGTYSWGGAFNTSFWIDPKEQILGVIMTQVRPNESDITDRFKTLVYQALE
ncbi:MAG: serine hydrolase [Woeseiaceae bacterium]|nr:serine hydrolase [Woeseiaceae bacterium]